MRRTVFLALLALVLFPAAARASDPIELLRDCVDDSVLQGDYTLAELREARKQLDTDGAEYSDCGDVLSRAIAAKTQKRSNNAGGGSGSPTGGGTGSSGDAGGGSSGATETTPPPPQLDTGPDTGTELPQTPQESAAIVQAAERGDNEQTINGHPVSPGTERLAADIGRNPLPGSLLLMVVLIVGAGAALAAPYVKRRVTGHPQA